MKNHKNITHEYKQYACNVTKYLPLMIATLNLLIYDNFVIIYLYQEALPICSAIHRDQYKIHYLKI